MRIGLRIFYNPAWMGGVNYVLNIARMLRTLPPGEQPHITFLTSAPQAEEIVKTAYQPQAEESADVEEAAQPAPTHRRMRFQFADDAAQDMEGTGA